jgi:hypothetical protein
MRVLDIIKILTTKVFTENCEVEVGTQNENTAYVVLTSV